MSKQWGHGFHRGHEQGFDTGAVIGQEAGGVVIGEYAWHSVSAAIEAIEHGDDLRGLMLLRTLRFALASVTGRDAPSLMNREEPQPEQPISSTVTHLEH